jgi:hypothetical protein
VSEGEPKNPSQAPALEPGKQPVAGLIVSAAISLMILATTIYGSIMGIPYLWNRFTNPIAGSVANPDSFQGTWIGNVTVKGEYSRSAFRAPEISAPKRAVMQITARTIFRWGSPQFRGDVNFCDASGSRTVGQYNNEPLLQLPQLFLLLRSPDGSYLQNDLRGTFHPGSIDVAWAMTDRDFIAGRLTKSSPEQFDALCSKLRGVQN